MGGHVARTGETVFILVGKPEERRSLERVGGRKREDNIKMDFKGMWCGLD
jgi:hypothetical protein